MDTDTTPEPRYGIRLRLAAERVTSHVQRLMGARR